MAFHHVAVATRDMPAIDAFYRQATGVELVKVEIAPSPEGGWAKHFFFDTGNGEVMAFWELHMESLGEEYPVALSTDMGLPAWVNHISFHADSREDLDQKRQRWVDNGYDVLEIDHNWCISIYTLDPNGTMIEWCADTRVLDAKDRDAAERTRTEAEPKLETAPTPIVHRAPAPVTS